MRCFTSASTSNTQGFWQQASRAARRSPALSALLALVFVLQSGACRRNKTPGTPKGAAEADGNARDTRPDPAAAVWAMARPLPATPGAPAPGTASGGTLRVHLESEPATLHPLQDDSASTVMVSDGLIYESLVDCADPSGDPRPQLASAWQMSPDGLALVLTLRPEVRWHDGRPLLPADVQASIEPLLRASARMRTLHALLADVEAIEIRPERAVRLRLLRPSGLALRALCEIPIMPAHLLAGTAVEQANLARQPVGTGPFRLVAWERGRRLRLQRNETYWGQPPWLDEIRFEIDTDGARALTRVKRADIDILPRVLDVHFPEQLERLGDKLEVIRLRPLRFSFLVVNTGNDPLSDARFRRALALLWDRRRLARDLRRGLVRPIAAPPFSPAPDEVRFDRQAAEQMLERAGYTDTNADGVRDRNGRPIRLRFVYPAGAKLAAKEGQQFALDLRRIGLLLDIVPVDAQAYLGRLADGGFDLAPATWSGEADEDPRLLFGPHGTFNYSRYSSPQLTALIDELVRAPGVAARGPIAGRIGDFLASEAPFIFLYRHEGVALVSTRVGGLSGSGERLDLRRVFLR